MAEDLSGMIFWALGGLGVAWGQPAGALWRMNKD